MRIPVRSWKFLVLLALLTGTGVTEAFAGEAGIPWSYRRNPEWPPDDTLLLSLRIARAMKDGRGIVRYKSLARQRRLMEKRPFRGKSEMPRDGHIFIGRRPPAGR